MSAANYTTLGKLGRAFYAAVLALVVLAATAPPKPTETFVVPFTSITDQPIEVSPVGKSGGQLTFGVRLEHERELEDMVAKKKAFVVRIMERHRVITEARLAAIYRDAHGKTVRLGLGFSSLEAAQKAAANLRQR